MTPLTDSTLKLLESGLGKKIPVLGNSIPPHVSDEVESQRHHSIQHTYRDERQILLGDRFHLVWGAATKKHPLTLEKSLSSAARRSDHSTEQNMFCRT